MTIKCSYAIVQYLQISELTYLGIANNILAKKMLEFIWQENKCNMCLTVHF